MKRIYICHPYSADPVGNTDRIRAICQRVVDLGCNPIAPQLSLPQFLDEGTQREAALALCLDLVETCNELWSIHPGQRSPGTLSAGQALEVDKANGCGIPVIYFYERKDGSWECVRG